MNIIVPIDIIDSMLVTSNVIEADYDEWNESTTYVDGSVVIITDVEKTATVVSNYLDHHRGNFIDGYAFFEIANSNLTIYEGADDGYTPYAVLLTDTVGKTALGYIGAGGGGRTLGSSLISDGGFSINGSPQWTWGSGWVWDTYVATSTNGLLLSQNAGLTINGLYYAGFTVGARTSGKVSLFYGTGSNTPFERTANGSYTEYGVASSGTDFGVNGHGASVLTVDDVFVKEVLEPVEIASGGIHIISEKNGTYRGWSNIDAGFDPCSITSYRIYSVGIVYHKRYESSVNDNINKFPPDNITYWVELGSTNRWNCFDKKINSQTTNTDTIEFTLRPGDFDSVAFFNLDANTITIFSDAGPDLTTNGGFDDDKGWTKETGWSIVATSSPSPSESPSTSPEIWEWTDYVEFKATADVTWFNRFFVEWMTTGTIISSSISPSASPSLSPSASLSPSSSISPSASPSLSSSKSPSVSPSLSPSASSSPSKSPSASPSLSPSASKSPSKSPSASPSKSPSASPSLSPSASKSPSLSPSKSPSASPSLSPSKSPSLSPSVSPSASPSPSPS
jgi:hypothetical protein